ncbi:MAG: MBG domain-containing protein [Pseudobacter sp.]|uniref:MBG domain-containing protein n=1 Tax=Pseudobacter sp. TaxID=2045420 RepID=UPI003F7FC1FE
MRKTLAVLLLLLIACSQQLFSQVFLQPKVPANAPTSTQVRVPNGLSTFTYLRAYALYPVGELNELYTGDVIKQLGFVATIGANAPAGGQIKFYIQNTSDQTFQKGTNWTNVLTGMTQVYNGTFTLPVTNGPAEIIVTLDAPFTYTGGGLYVAWDYLGSQFCSSPVTFAAEGSALVPGCASANSATAAPEILGTTAFRPQLIFGFDNPFGNDLAVTQLKANGIFSPGLGEANKVTAMIRNRGYNAQNNFTVSWTAAGLPYSTVVASLAPGDSTTVEMTIPASTAAGTIQIKAAVGADERSSNNSMQITQEIVCDEFRYAGRVTPNEAIGFNTGSGIIAVLHKSPATSVMINAIRIRLSDNAPSIGNNIKGVLLDQNGVILATSADFPITAANFNTEVSIPLATPFTIPANTSFYAGIIQSASNPGYFPVGTDKSVKMEPNRYFTFFATGGTPSPVTEDLGALMIGFAGQPVAELTNSTTGVLKQGQKATLTATTGFSYYDFSVNSIVKQSSPSNVFVYAPNNNDVVSVNVSNGGCAYTAQHTVTMQATDIVPTAGIVYVKKGATGNGSSWANAAGELADVLLAARSNTAITQVWMAGGTYLPLYSAHDGDLGQSNGRRNSFVVTGNLKLYGGFAGTETTLNQRNLTIMANRTILSGDLDGNDDPNGAIVGNNAYNVVIVAGNYTPVFDGLTIRGGKAESSAGTRTIDGITVDANVGGGMNFKEASPELNNMIIQGNTAVAGGGVSHNIGHVTISNSLIAGNMASGGGGIYNSTGSYLALVNTTVSGNTATNGGAIFNSMAAMEIFNSIIYGNSSGIGGTLVNVTYSVLQDNISGTGNSTVDPLFVDMPSHSTAPFIVGNYALQTNSPAVNTGDNAAILALPAAFQVTDVAGNTRIVNLANGGIVDRGAYELQRQLQTITVSDLNKVYGNADFEPGATTTSGLTISYASSDNNIAEAFQDATDGNKWKIKVKRAGDVTITASQAGTPEYFPATDETFELRIATKPVTVQLTAATLSKVYDATTDGTLAVTNLAIATGDIVSGDDLSLNISSSAFSYDNKNVGDNKQITLPLNVISLTGTSAGNYNIANTTDLTATTGKITPAELTVTAVAKTKVYGESDPVLTYSYAGFATGDAAVFTGALSRNPGEDAGDYAIIQNTLSAGTNYSILYTSANLTISKATQTITWVQDLVTGCNGVSPITLTATSSSGLDVSYLAASSSIATVTGQTLTPVGEGATTITAIQAGDANHEPATAVVKTFSYQLSSALRQHFADAMFFDNSGGKYVQWQWYKNGNLVSGFNTPYYNEATALNGTYYAMVTDKNGNMVQTCPVTFTGSGTVAAGVKVAPNPARAGSTVSITCSYTEPALQGATLQISNISGTVVQRITTVRPVNTVVMPAAGGLYVITLTLSNGQKSTVNVLVN